MFFVISAQIGLDWISYSEPFGLSKEARSIRSALRTRRVRYGLRRRCWRAEITRDHRTGNAGAPESRAPLRNWKRKEHGRWSRYSLSVTAPVPCSRMRKAENQTTSTGWICRRNGFPANSRGKPATVQTAVRKDHSRRRAVIARVAQRSYRQLNVGGKCQSFTACHRAGLYSTRTGHQR